MYLWALKESSDYHRRDKGIRDGGEEEQCVVHQGCFLSSFNREMREGSNLFTADEFLSPHYSYLSCCDSQMLGEKDTLHSQQGSIEKSAPHPDKSTQRRGVAKTILVTDLHRMENEEGSLV